LPPVPFATTSLFITDINPAYVKPPVIILCAVKALYDTFWVGLNVQEQATLVCTSEAYTTYVYKII